MNKSDDLYWLGIFSFYDTKIRLKKIKELVNARRERGKIYLEDLRNIGGLLLPSVPRNVQHSFYRFPIIMKTKSSQRKDLISMVYKKTGIELNTGYPSHIYKQPLY